MGGLIRIILGIIVGFLFAAFGHCGIDGREALVERVAVVEHEQWMDWTRSVADEVGSRTRDRWKKYWIPYKDLPEDIKELDRRWARKKLDAAGL